MNVDQARGNDQVARVDLLDFGFRISNFGLIGDSSIDNQEIRDFVALVCGIDNPAVANDDRAHRIGERTRPRVHFSAPRRKASSPST